MSQEREKDREITPVVDQVSGKDGKEYRIENGMLRNLCEELARKLTDHWSQRSELFNFRDNTFCCYNFDLARILVWAFRPSLCLEQCSYCFVSLLREEF